MDTAVPVGFRVIRTRRSEDYMRIIKADAHEAIAAYDEAGWLSHPRLAHADPGTPHDWILTAERQL